MKLESTPLDDFCRRSVPTGKQQQQNHETKMKRAGANQRESEELTKRKESLEP